jgi:hypothetical protein
MDKQGRPSENIPKAVFLWTSDAVKGSVGSFGLVVGGFVEAGVCGWAGALSSELVSLEKARRVSEAGFAERVSSGEF